MRLAHIKLAGFKSFVDPTSVSVSYDLVGIVGPNGCGKSNIIDAVRWVLGESKASALRGDSMQDVIFAGSDTRKALGRASVEIIFENHLGQVTGQWSTYSEIAIKRILQRDGVSSYFINNLPVRRRDIADLFLGTGAGSRGYAIIEQGMISQIIEAKPLELKTFLEEAAGISQYRERRQETSLRLTEARKNLVRLEDISQTLSEQLRHLEEQAATAVQYQALQEKLQNSQALLWCQRKIEVIHQYEQIKQELSNLEAALQLAVVTQHSAEKEFEETRLSEYRINERLLQAQGRLYGVEAEIGRLEQEIAHFSATKERLNQQICQIEEQLQKNESLKAVNLEQRAHWQQEKITAEQKHRQMQQQCEAYDQQLPEMESDFSRCQNALNESRHNLLRMEQSYQLTNNQIAHVDKSIQQLEARQARLSKEQNELVFIDSIRLAQLQHEIDHIEISLQQAAQKQQVVEGLLHETSQLKQKIQQHIQETKYALSKAEARQTALINLQQKLENNQQLQSWLDSKQWRNLPRLWQGIQILPQWEIALEAVLRERLNSIRLTQLDQLLDTRDQLPIGKWTVFEEKSAKVASNQWQITPKSQALKGLLSLITFNNEHARFALEDWLNHVYVADDIKEAFSQRTQLQFGDMIVTPEGHIVTHQSCTFYAPDSQLHGVLSRQQELISLKTEIEQFEVAIAKQQNELVQIELQYNQTSTEIQQIKENNKQLYQRSHQLQLERVKLIQAEEQIAKRNQNIVVELNEIKQALLDEITLRQTAFDNLADIQAKTHILKQQAEQTKSASDDAGQLLVKHRQMMQQSAREMQESIFHLKSCESKINEIAVILQHVDEDLVRLSEQRAKFLKEKDACDDTAIKTLLEQSNTHRLVIESEVGQVRQELNDIAHRLREIDITRMTFEQKSRALRETISQVQLKEQAVLLNIDQLNDLIENSRIDIASLMPSIGKNSASKLQNEIQQCNNKIAALGAVNLAAIEELEKSRIQQANLLMQLNDLYHAVATLDGAIRQIDRETQMRLKDTFIQVNAHLNEIFPVIFTGGQAKLVLLGGEAIDAGFMLMAQPPGKKNSSIHLLSGGEKALTALALIFSLFKLNPAPFCLLDEVDAPLDDSNTERFCELVKTMAKQTQFLFISHNKITMEMAHRLIGVTMQEQGVSKIVAVDLADAVKLGKREIHLTVK